MSRPRYEGKPLNLHAVERHAGEVTIYNPHRGTLIWTYYRYCWWVTDGTHRVVAWSPEEAQEIAEVWSRQKRVPRRYRRAVSA